jgi:DNA repair protein RecO (recombination protein O)
VAIYETDAIILKTYELSDADRIAVLLTRDHGLIRAVAKGAKRSRSKFGGALEFLTEARASFFQKEGQELASFRAVEIEMSSFQLASDPLIQQEMAYLMDLLILLTAPAEPNDKLFRLVKALIAALREDNSSLFYLRLYFKLWLLKLAGYMPELNRCHSCRGILGEDSDSSMSSDLRILCSNCRAAPEPTRSAALKLARNALRRSPSEYCSSARKAEIPQLNSLEAFLDRSLAVAGGRPLPVRKDPITSAADA